MDNSSQKQLSAKDLVKALATNRALLSMIAAAIRFAAFHAFGAVDEYVLVHGLL